MGLPIRVLDNGAEPAAPQVDIVVRVSTVAEPGGGI